MLVAASVAGVAAAFIIAGVELTVGVAGYLNHLTLSGGGVSVRNTGRVHCTALQKCQDNEIKDNNNKQIPSSGLVRKRSLKSIVCGLENYVNFIHNDDIVRKKEFGEHFRGGQILPIRPFI